MLALELGFYAIRKLCVIEDFAEIFHVTCKYH